MHTARPAILNSDHSQPCTCVLRISGLQKRNASKSERIRLGLIVKSPDTKKGRRKETKNRLAVKFTSRRRFIDAKLGLAREAALAGVAVGDYVLFLLFLCLFTFTALALALFT